MPSFKYKARDRSGKLVTGTMAGDDKSHIAKHLGSMGYTPITVEEAGRAGLGIMTIIAGFFKSVPKQDVAIFTRQLLTLQKAGITLLVSLNVLEKQTKNRYFKDVIKDILSKVEEGSSLSDAMSKYPLIFDELYVNMIKAGEASGLLDEMLGRLSEFCDKEMDHTAKFKAATRYPLITLGALFCAFLILVNFVIPKFMGVYAQFNAALPLPTRILLGLYFAMKNYGILMILAVIAVIVLFIKYINTKSGRFLWDTFKLKVPVMGSIIYMVVMSRFARTMSVLIKSGLPILQVMDMVSRTVGNATVAKTIDNIATSVREGKGVAEPMRLSGIFPPIVVQMVAIGEETGKVDELLMKVSEYYDQQSDYAMQNLSTAIEPMFVLVLGGMVLTMALAIFLPIWNLVSVIKY